MLMQQFEQLNEKTQNALLRLHTEKSNSTNLQEKLNDILDCNGIEVVPVNSVALYLTIPRSVSVSKIVMHPEYCLNTIQVQISKTSMFKSELHSHLTRRSAPSVRRDMNLRKG